MLDGPTDPESASDGFSKDSLLLSTPDGDLWKFTPTGGGGEAPFAATHFTTVGHVKESGGSARRYEVERVYPHVNVEVNTEEIQGPFRVRFFEAAKEHRGKSLIAIAVLSGVAGAIVVLRRHRGN
jgi:hypothetical protein